MEADFKASKRSHFSSTLSQQMCFQACNYTINIMITNKVHTKWDRGGRRSSRRSVNGHRRCPGDADGQVTHPSATCFKTRMSPQLQYGIPPTRALAEFRNHIMFGTMGSYFYKYLRARHIYSGYATAAVSPKGVHILTLSSALRTAL